MKKEFKVFSEKIKKMLNFMNSEYEKVNLNYEDDLILKKCIPLVASSKLEKSKQNDINEFLYMLFSPSLSEMSKMIEKGIIEWSEVSKNIDLDKIPDDEIAAKEDILELFYSAHERLYFYKKIKYNLFFDFLMQMYLFFESEINKFVQRNINYNSVSLCSSIKYIEQAFSFSIDDKIKKEIYLYKDIINVYKHGFGRSFKKIVRSNSEIFNYTEEYEDMSFVFDLNKISINDFIIMINEFMKNIDSNI